MAQEANRPIYRIAHTGFIPTPIILILYFSYLGIIVTVTSHCQSHVPHALVSFHLTRLYMRHTWVQNWWCHHDTSHFWSSQLQSYPCQQWRKHACHVNSQVSHICHIRVTLLPCHSLPCHLHINFTSNSLCRINNRYYVIRVHYTIWTNVDLNRFEPDSTLTEPVTTIDHWLSLPWSLTLTLTNCLWLTLVFSIMPIQSRFLHTFWFWVYFSLWLLHPWNLIISPLGFTYAKNSQTHSHNHSILGRIHDPSNAAIHGHFHVSFNASSRDLPKFMFQTQDIVKPLPWVWEKVLKILVYYGLLCVMVQEVQCMEFSTLNSNNLWYTLEKNIRNKILIHFYGLCA